MATCCYSKNIAMLQIVDSSPQAISLTLRCSTICRHSYSNYVRLLNARRQLPLSANTTYHKSACVCRICSFFIYLQFCQISYRRLVGNKFFRSLIIFSLLLRVSRKLSHNRDHSRGRRRWKSCTSCGTSWNRARKAQTILARKISLWTFCVNRVLYLSENTESIIRLFLTRSS